ncbi:hypothetical protein C5167_000549 [Papaver somniferum]|uniref:Protein kinase domain-containing protein n=1 Tax=Papaver somniferum TaxID=3469 RepID=A0A4Y7KVN8_PAPSO|nr:hypothetical protein C5167_000549 [Papaver somniferum]
MASILGVRVFKLRELIVATDKFSPGRVLNEGKLGRVYKGILKDGQEVAVKRFAKQVDLWGEVRMLSCLDHPNIVKMIGYCDEGKDHMIVCELMPLRSLNLHLHDLKLGKGKKPLDWKSRMTIAEAVARDLEYLHHGMSPPIIYNCLEVSKILLNENYSPKLSEFGSADIAIPVDHCRVRTKPACGYVSPESATTGYITSKSDVFGFGVVLLELISGQKAFDTTRNGERDIVAWARPMLSDSKKFPEIADPLMERQYPYSELVQAIDLAKMCVQQDPHKRPHHAESQYRVEADEDKYQHSIANARVFELRELIVGTDNFNPGRVLGEGSLGRVYKGILGDGHEVAVKRFYEQADFWAEVRMLSCIEHANLVKMIGYCDIGEDHIIVYEFMPLRSLNLHLQDLKPGNKPLDWQTRMKVAEGVAKALEYLHDHNDPPVIYAGLKRSGILLDENYNRKVSDFDCAKHGPTGDYTMMGTKLLRAYGYIGIEYPLTGGRQLIKSDVYSFGVLLLELISGRKTIDKTIFCKEPNLVAWARPLLSDSKKFPEIADPLMEGQYSYLGLVQALGLAKMCIQEMPFKRPRTAEIVTTLSNLVSQIYEEERGTAVASSFTPSSMHDG